MAYQPNPNDPVRTGLTDDEINRQALRNNLDNELRAEPELDDATGNGGKIAMLALAGALLLGAVFYGLNNSSVNQAGTSPASQTAQTNPATPAASSGMRDVTPRINSEPGTTTGAAPSRPSTPSAPPSMNNSATPPADSAPAR